MYEPIPADASTAPRDDRQTAMDGSRHPEPGANALDWIKRLIAFDTTSRNSNLQVMAEIGSELAKRGFVLRETRDAGGAKANLLATLPAADGCLSGGLCLSGHVDAVPVDGQSWSSDPFEAEVRDGRLHGRGACDMKGFVGTAIAVAIERCTRPLRAPIHLALSYDEEMGCLGAPSLVEDMISAGIVPDGCIVGEPTMMKVVSAHKGANVGRCTVEGVARHSSLAPHGINAIEFASRIIAHMQAMADGYAATGPFSDGFDVPFTTLQTGLIQGGIAVSTVPAACSFTFEFRNLPGTLADTVFDSIREYALSEVLPIMHRRSGGAGRIEFERLASAPAFEADEGNPFTRLIRTLTGDDLLRKVAYGTEAGIFNHAGIPTVVCGPGDIAQAHTADEFVELSQIARCEAVLHELADRMCAPETIASTSQRTGL